MSRVSLNTKLNIVDKKSDIVSSYDDGVVYASGYVISDTLPPSASVLRSSLATAAPAPQPVVPGDLAALDASGNAYDSGFKVDDLSPPLPSVLYSSAKLEEKAKKVVPALAGDLASIDALGQYQDSGFIVDDLAAPSSSVLYSSLKTKALIDSFVPLTQVSYSGAVLNVPAGFVATPIVYDTDIYNPNGWYDKTTGRFTPTVAGWYSVLAIVDIGVVGSVGSLVLQKNGLEIARITLDGIVTLYVIKAVYFDGVADYADLLCKSTLASAKAQFDKVSYFEASYLHP